MEPFEEKADRRVAQKSSLSLRTSHELGLQLVPHPSSIFPALDHVLFLQFFSRNLITQTEIHQSHQHIIAAVKNNFVDFGETYFSDRIWYLRFLKSST